MDLKGKIILFIVAPENYRDEELSEPRRILEGYNAKTVVASKNTKIARGMLGGKVTVNLGLSDVKVSEYDAIVFVGGSGCTIYWNDKNAINIAKEAYLKGRVVGAICLASGTLANAGLLNRIEATGWGETKQLIEGNGGIYTGSGVEISGKIITAQGPKNAKEFGEAIAKALS